ncbi:ABC transporter substrate-binding protein [Natronomonas marina]|jgi:iron complex transport system substrate-binding protein|uniref:ABC transporter substrate-binding protein n=1 Tax=Natronomonas marina TaxID=2961939 RepID=UPI0020C9652B|nr:ABC transporter substrate-binding protein [Natronomonas marina]
MAEDAPGTAEGPARRDYIEYAGAVVGGGLLTGCTGGPDSPGGANQGDDPTPTGTVDESYSVSMEPVGSVEFEEVPETWFPYTGDYADMGVALGRGDGLEAIGIRRRFGAHHYEELPGVSVDKSELTQLWQDGTDKEVFYELDADIHVVDPEFMINRIQWDQGDVDEIGENVAPFFGNTTFTRVYGWHDYEYYSMYGAFEKLAEVFDERERYEAFEQYHDEILADVEGRLPAETLDVAVLVPAGTPPEEFWPYRIGSGTQSKHWNDLNVRDALAENDVTDAQVGGGKIDYETLLEIDPEVIAIRLPGEITQEWVDENVTAHMRDHSVASELAAVRNDRVVYGGMTYQGPIIHLFQLETAAQGLYPDEFGGEQLFDRQRVADIVNGNI